MELSFFDLSLPDSLDEGEGLQHRPEEDPVTLPGTLLGKGIRVNPGDTLLLHQEGDEGLALKVTWGRCHLLHTENPFFLRKWDIAFGNGWFMAVGEGGLVAVSQDGVNWRKDRPTDRSLFGVTFGDRFVIVGSRTILVGR